MRYTHRLVQLIACATVLSACSWFAPPQRPHRVREEWHPPSEMLDKYADGNGVVTRTAMEAGLKVDFAKADLDHNGCLDENEVRAVNEERWKEGASTESPLIDFKHSGCVDFDEFAATPRSLFDLLDRKGEGRLTPQQLHPGRPPNATKPPVAAPPSGN
jgi:hypothetical protein